MNDYDNAIEIERLNEEIAMLRKERDEALEALKPLLKYAEENLSHGGEWCKQVIDARDVLAKVSGKV